MAKLEHIRPLRFRDQVASPPPSNTDVGNNVSDTGDAFVH